MKDVLYLIPDSDVIEAARLASEQLGTRLIFLNIRERLHRGLVDDPWDHYVDSVGGVHSGLVCPACGESWVPGHTCVEGLTQRD